MFMLTPSQRKSMALAVHRPLAPFREVPAREKPVIQSRPWSIVHEYDARSSAILCSFMVLVVHSHAAALPLLPIFTRLPPLFITLGATIISI